MTRFLPYDPEQAYLLPPSVKDELGADHLCFFVHAAVERLDLSEFPAAYSSTRIHCRTTSRLTWHVERVTPKPETLTQHFEVLKGRPYYQTRKTL